ncbi:PAS domain-containing protein [Azospirillum canadense]|uniref:PAS domain-containing protein n=1 Tax=Azospirillum canadense TaxID=403962 RepID=UPI002227BA68|nr:PAS domain-containing protein [Azospirillum canadense]MCW2238981.1 PAS domain S-box-containing protein [Azospirillum canadense]
MDDERKTKAQLIDELADLRRRVGALEAFEGERAAIQTELSGTRQRLQYLLAVSPAIIYTTHASGDYACTFVSENLHTIMGYSAEEMTTDPKCWPDRLHPEDAPRVFSELAPLIGQGGGSVEYRFRHRDGHYVCIQDTFKVIHDATGQPLELVGAWADITERKRAEEEALQVNAEMQETKRYLTLLIQSSPDAIISTDRAGNIVLFSEGAETLLGYQAEEVIGHAVSALYGSQERADEVVREIRKRGGTVAGFESVLWAKDGRSIPVLISASCLLDDERREVGTVAFHTDLRERKRAEEALQLGRDEMERRVEERTTELKAARERLQYLLTVTPGIIYTNQPSDYTCTFVSENVDPVMGFAPWEMLEDRDFWSKRLHPEDAKRVFEEMAPLIEQGGGAIEYRFRHRDGHYVWIQDTFKVVRDDAGRPLEIVGSWANISDRKQAEQALGERMALMNDLQNLVAASPAVIYTTKVSGDYACTFVSENLKSTMGYAPWEMREDATFWSKRLHPDDAKRVFKEMSPLIEQGGGAIEYRFRHRRGHYIWIQDTFSVMYDGDGKPREIVGSWADISDRKRVETELQRLADQVELRNRFIRQTFGRYLTDEVVATLLESPSGLRMGGEKRKVTMMMADLRGFTALSERTAPERVVTLLNRYLTTMVKIVKDFEGTVDDFIGDAIFVLFGAPLWQEDDAQRAVACAVAMQQAMAEVNEQNWRDELPEVEMGIGIHTGSVVVGNIGSPDRTKYDVVGSHVNLTFRIQSYTTGGQILVSDATYQELDRILSVGRQIEIKAKGIEQPVLAFEVLGIRGRYKLFLPETVEAVLPLSEEIPVTYALVDGSHLTGEVFKGVITKLSSREAEAHLETPVPNLSNLKINLLGAEGHELSGALYGKVVGRVEGSSTAFSVRFTAMSPEVEQAFRQHRKSGRSAVAP